MELQIADRIVGKGRPCMVVGEVGQAHDGSLGMAHAFVDAIASAGADAVKFQTHIASAESTPSEPWRVRFSHQDDSRYAYWRRMEFSEEQWRGLKRHAEERGVIFLSSPFSLEAADLLMRVGVAAWKIASGEVCDSPLLWRLLDTGLPVLLSTGMSSISEIDQGVALLKRREAPFAVLQCTTAYPCPPQMIGLNVIRFFQERYGCPVGLSDHSGKIYAGLAAATLGIQLLEVHVTLSREMAGPDVAASLTTSELRQLVEGVRYIETVCAHCVDKNAIAEQMAPLREVFTKSVVARIDLPAGVVLREEHLTCKKPGTGIAACRLPELIGRRLRRSVVTDRILQEDDLEAEE